MGSLRDIRKRIGTVKNTRQITRAMKMVAAAKLRRATDAAISARPYSEKLVGMVGLMASQVDEISHPLLDEKPDLKSCRIIIFASDKGLCGSYNSNLLKAADAFIEERQASEQVSVTLVGKKAVAFGKRQGYDIAESHIEIPPSEYYAWASRLADQAAADYANGVVGSYWIAFQEFESALTQVPRIQQILPVPLDGVESESTSMDFIYEPEQAVLLGMLLPRLVENRIHKAFLEANASEQASRMMAMDNATRNASELIDKLTLQYNQARQAAITTELVEIVSGAEAL